jgi:hypothetical protein
MTIALWLFPESDFASWCALVGTPEVDDYIGYLTLLAALQADQERMGNEVVRVHLTVAEIRSELAVRGWESTPDNRAAIVGLLHNRA